MPTGEAAAAPPPLQSGAPLMGPGLGGTGPRGRVRRSAPGQVLHAGEHRQGPRDESCKGRSRTEEVTEAGRVRA